MTLIACITDTHYGARKGSKTFHDYFKKFYENVFFPELEKRNIKHQGGMVRLESSRQHR